MHVHFPTRAFDAVAFTELADYWWQAHGSKTRSQFQYLYPRVLEHFADKRRARDVTPDTVDAFLDHLAAQRKLFRVERESSPHDRERHLQLRRETRAVRQESGRGGTTTARTARSRPHRVAGGVSSLWDKAKAITRCERSSPLQGRRRCARARCCRCAGSTSIWAMTPYVTLVRTKSGHQRHVPIPAVVLDAQGSAVLRDRRYLFPSRPTARCPEPRRPYRWDLGKPFRALAKAADLQDVRIHDLRHAGATILMTLGVPDPIVRKITGHRSRELERYQHLTPELRALTVNLIATELFRAKKARKENGTPTGTVRGRRVTRNSGAPTCWN